MLLIYFRIGGMVEVQPRPNSRHGFPACSDKVGTSTFAGGTVRPHLWQVLLIAQSPRSLAQEASESITEGEYVT